MSVNIKVKNFQSIVDADITVDGFTILVGESSQGKSACLRAVNAACYNKFKQSFLRYGADSMTIGITYSDEPYSLVVRKTKKESPEYELGELVFQKLNRTVPEEVDAFNNFGTIEGYESKYPLNFFAQFSKPLLLEFSQKRVLEILSSSRAFDDANEAASRINKRKEQNNGSFKTVSSMISDNKRQLSEQTEAESLIHDGIERLKQTMSEHERAERETGAVEDLRSHADAYDRTEQRKRVLESAADVCGKTIAVTESLRRIEELGGHNKTRNETIERIESLQKRLTLCERCNSISEQLKSVRNDLLDELEKHVGESRTVQKRTNALRATLAAAERCVETRTALNRAETEQNKLSVITDLMNAARATQRLIRDKRAVIDNRVCPVCGNKIM